MAKTRRGRGIGSIHQRSDGLWVGMASLGYDANGNRIRQAVFGKTKREAQDKLLKLQQDALAGPPVRPERMTLNQLLNNWLVERKMTVTESTYANCTSLVNTHIRPALGHQLLKRLSYAMVNRFYESLDEKGLSKRTVHYIARLLRAALDDAVAKGLVPANPAKLAAKRSYQSTEARCLTQEEMARFLAAIEGERLRDAFILFLYTGLRAGELFGLTWNCVVLGAAKISVRQSLTEVAGRIAMGTPKTAAGRRTISLGAKAVTALKRQRKLQAEERLAAGEAWSNDLNLVFTTREGKPLRRTTVSRRDLKRITTRAGLDGVTLHTFRHVHTSILIFQGMDIKAISRRLGHESVVTTLELYGHLLPGQDERAAELMDELMATLKNGNVRQQ